MTILYYIEKKYFEPQLQLDFYDKIRLSRLKKIKPPVSLRINQTAHQPRLILD